MKEIVKKAALIATWLAAGLAAGEAGAAQPLLVADLSPGEQAVGFNPDRLTPAGSLLFMRHADLRHGSEPWVSDGTAAGTRRLADVCPGNCGSDPAGFAQIGDRLVFATRENDGTQAIRALTPGGIETIAGDLELVGSFEPLGGFLYFSARRTGETPEAYRTDGTRAGTAPAGELCGEDAAACPLFTDLEAHAGRLYYTESGGLYAYSPETGRRRLATMEAARLFTPLNASRLVFYGCATSPTECRAYATDGTASGTTVLTAGGRFPTNFTPFAGRVFYRVEYGEVVSTDGTVIGTRVEDFGEPAFPPPGAPPVELLGTSSTHLIYVKGSAPNIELRSRSAVGVDLLLATGLTQAAGRGQANGRLFLDYRQGALERFAATGGLPTDIFVLAEREIDRPGAAFGGRLYYTSTSGDPDQYRLWSSDGTPAGTRPIDFAPPRHAGSFPIAHRQGASILLEAATANGLWRVDPASLAIHPLRAGLSLRALAGSVAYVRDDSALLAIAENDSETWLSSVPISELAAAPGGRAYFNDSAPGQQLWESDGTAAGTRLLFDLEPGWTPSCLSCSPQLPANITPSGETVFFIAEGTAAPHFALWSWRRGAAAPVELMAFPGPLGLMNASNGRVAFVAPAPGSGGTSRSFLWVSDGTPAGTRPFFQLPVSAPLSEWAAAGPRLYFTLQHLHGLVPASSLWVTDFSTAGTSLLLEGARSFRELAAAGDHLYFNGRPAPGEGIELGFSDGTPAGTRWLELAAGPEGSYPRDLFALADQRAVFAASAGEAGNELWISNGTLAGTERLTDLAPGPDASSPSDFAEMPGVGNTASRLFFRADDGTTGAEPWALDLESPSLPPCPEELLCLRDGRFEVSVEVSAAGGTYPGGRVLAAAESGIFHFFSPNNWEMLVKVLDGCAINDAFWVYASAATDVAYRLEVKDRASGVVRTYDSAAGPAKPILDSAAFATCGFEAPAPAYSPAAPPATAASRCEGDPAAFCFGPAGRYRASLGWRTAEAEGRAQPVPYGSADSGLFTFFSPSNWEMMVKVLDGCAINGRIWVFAAGTTDVGWTLEVEDRQTRAIRTYGTPLGTPARTVTDTAAFICD